MIVRYKFSGSTGPSLHNVQIGADISSAHHYIIILLGKTLPVRHTCMQETASLPAITPPPAHDDSTAKVQVSEEVRRRYPGGGLFMYWPESRAQVDEWVREGRPFPANELARATASAVQGCEGGGTVQMRVPELTPGEWLHVGMCVYLCLCVCVCGVLCS